MTGGISQPARQRGVALAIVVWFIAGMSLLVAGIVSHARVDTRMTQVHLGRAKAVAAGDGAIQLAMLERQQGYASSSAGPLVSEGVYRLGETEVTVRLYPASGLINLNAAPAEVLETLFKFTGQVPGGEAKLIADNVVKWRNPGKSSRQRRRFFALEDLLRVDGVTRGLLDGIRNFVVAGDWAGGTMDWSAAPQPVMGMLEQLNPGQVDSVMRRRENLTREQVSGPRGRGSNSSGSDVYRADALVSYGGRTWLRRRWVVSGVSGQSQLPWRTVRTEPPRVVEG